ncbi:MAG: YbaK/EbsC family protein [Halioglobus sp.]|nr:YbaK/EbsC family protein [Halioglobus sp.]
MQTGLKVVMQAATSKSALKVQAILGDEATVFEFDASTRTAADAAAAIGCSVAQIAKSLIFRGKQSKRPVLVIASGSIRVDERRIASLLGEKIGRADAGFVRENTGFAIGGVPPVGHLVPPATFIDESLFIHATIWAAGGTPNSVFQLTPQDLARLTGGTVAAIAGEDAL